MLIGPIGHAGRRREVVRAVTRTVEAAGRLGVAIRRKPTLADRAGLALQGPCSAVEPGAAPLAVPVGHPVSRVTHLPGWGW
jgi:hypothetical protein